MAILERGSEPWTQLRSIIERVGVSNVLYACAAILRDLAQDAPPSFNMTGGVGTTLYRADVCERAARETSH